MTVGELVDFFSTQDRTSPVNVGEMMWDEYDHTEALLVLSAVEVRIANGSEPPGFIVVGK